MRRNRYAPRHPRLSRRLDPASLQAGGILVDRAGHLLEPHQLHPAAWIHFTGKAHPIAWRDMDQVYRWRTEGLPGVRPGETPEQARCGLRDLQASETTQAHGKARR